jgi:hypothetical protein
MGQQAHLWEPQPGWHVPVPPSGGGPLELPEPLDAPLDDAPDEPVDPVEPSAAPDPLDDPGEPPDDPFDPPDEVPPEEPLPDDAPESEPPDDPPAAASALVPGPVCVGELHAATTSAASGPGPSKRRTMAIRPTFPARDVLIESTDGMNS